MALAQIFETTLAENEFVHALEIVVSPTDPWRGYGYKPEQLETVDYPAFVDELRSERSAVFIEVGQSDLPGSLMALLKANDASEAERWLASAPEGPGAELVAYVINEPAIPIQQSPLELRSLGQLVGAAPVVGLLFAVGAPPVLLVAGPFGLLALRAVGRAVWEGIAPEVTEFSRDTSAYLFNRLRAKIGIPPRDGRQASN